MAAEGKHPKKGILKNSSSFDKPDYQHRKEMKWDEMSILATYHPPGKDYGHMKVDEPPTPYAKLSDLDDESEDGGEISRKRSVGTEDSGIDATTVAERLEMLQNSHSPKTLQLQDTFSDEDEFETEEERRHRKMFEQKRKLHYNEFQAAQLAKKLLAAEEAEEEEEVCTKPAAE